MARQGKLPGTTGDRASGVRWSWSSQRSARAARRARGCGGAQAWRRAIAPRTLGDLRDNRLTAIGLGPALGLLAAALIIVSCLALGGAITLALLPLLLGVAIMVALIAARRQSGDNERLADLAERLDQSLESLKDLQWEVREREARYRDLLDHQGDVILRRDRDLRLTFVNDAFCRTFGLTRETALGQMFTLPAGERGKPEAPLPDGEGRRSRIVELATAAGPRWFVWEDFAIADAQGRA